MLYMSHSPVLVPMFLTRAHCRVPAKPHARLPPKARTLELAPLQQQTGSTLYVIVSLMPTIPLLTHHSFTNRSRHHKHNQFIIITNNMSSNNTKGHPSVEKNGHQPSATEADSISLIADLGIPSSYTLHQPPAPPSPPSSPSPEPVRRRKAVKPPMGTHSLSGRPFAERPFKRDMLSRWVCCACRVKKGVEASFVNGEKCLGCEYSGCNKCGRYTRVQSAVVGLCGGCGKGMECVCE
jgi:hypothetical protein